MFIKKTHSKSGFTLIELMVVMSIISMLSSVVLVSLNGARNKGRNARIQEEVGQLKNSIESSWNGTYYTNLPSISVGSDGSTVARLDAGGVSVDAQVVLTDILKQNGGLYGGNSVNFGMCKSYSVNNGYPGGASTNGLTVFTDNGDPSCTQMVFGKSYAIYASYLPTIGSSGYFCVDSSGTTKAKDSGGIPSVPGPGITCN